MLACSILTFCPPPFRRKAEGHCFWFSVGRGAWFQIFSRYLVPLTPPTVYVRSFWNFTGVLRMVWRCACGFFQNPEIIFYHFLHILNLDIFWVLILQKSIGSRYLVPLTPSTVFGRAFWNFTWAFRMAWKYACVFFQNPEIIFYHFFRIFNLDIFSVLILQKCIGSRYLVPLTPPTVFSRSFWNLTGVLRMVWRCAYGFFRILKLFFITFYTFWTDIFWVLILQKSIGSRYLVPLTPPTVFDWSFWNFTRAFRMAWRYACVFFQNPEIDFYHFFHIFNLDIFWVLILQKCIVSRYLVPLTPPTVFGQSFWNFTGVLRMVWRCACGFFRILKLFFITFYTFWTDIFWVLILQKSIGSRYLVPLTPRTVFGPSFWNFTWAFRMAWRYACGFFRILK